MLPPTFKGEYYVDGGFTRMQPVAPVLHSQTLTVCPFSGEIDICPSDTPSMWDMVVSGCSLKANKANGIRIVNALYPMDLETLEQAYHSGYKDAIHFLQCNDIVSCVILHKEPQLPLNCNQPRMYLENAREEDKKMKVEKEKEATALTSFNTIKYMHKDRTADEKLDRTPPNEEPLCQFDMVDNVLLAIMVAYLSMFGLPARIVSHLLIPLMLFFYPLVKIKHRLELFFWRVPESGFWAWQGLRHFTIFFFNTCVCTIKKNIQERVMPTVLLLRWLITTRH
ncbi:Patatin-like phospholipase domain-containing protein 1 [Liparis tanakae]|uniref:Patatin-like phospholipase domain-containing protein 1 n=1 Tax=Liparis tanakae TaxID=230148 RepID=A0A4Z2IWK1_9TELE|nr:Patatin-like phospholipase domain-containing protein 1 [Liparis tanakae]